MKGNKLKTQQHNMNFLHGRLVFPTAFYKRNFYGKVFHFFSNME